MTPRQIASDALEVGQKKLCVDGTEIIRLARPANQAITPVVFRKMGIVHSCHYADRDLLNARDPRDFIYQFIVQARRDLEEKIEACAQAAADDGEFYDEPGIIGNVEKLAGPRPKLIPTFDANEAYWQAEENRLKEIYGAAPYVVCDETAKPVNFDDLYRANPLMAHLKNRRSHGIITGIGEPSSLPEPEDQREAKDG